MEWIIELVGDVSDLSALAQSLNGPDIKIIHNGQAYILGSKDFDPKLPAEKIREKAQRIIDLLNGATRLALDSVKAMHIGALYKIHENGKREIYASAENVIHLRGVAAAIQISHLAAR